MKAVCDYIGHRRSKYVRPIASHGGWKSNCRFCGKPMVLVAPRTWKLARLIRAA